MAEARLYLIDSAMSYIRSGENRLTELFATVLAQHAPLARAFLGRVFGDGDRFEAATRFEVRTQEQRAPGCIPDLTLRVLDGGLMAEVWSEHKTDSDFRPDQREDYLRALTARGGDCRLLTITRARHDDTPGCWQHMSWQDVAELLDRVGQTTAGEKNWRKLAMRPEAAARDRLLAELLCYLEQRGFAVVRPMTRRHIEVLRDMEDTGQVVGELVRRVKEHIHGFVPGSAGKSGTTWWFVVEAPPDAWELHRTTHEQVWCDVNISSVDDWWAQGTGQPAVAAGYTFEPALYSQLAAVPALVERLREHGYTFEEWGGYLRCWRTRPLTEFVDAGTNVDDQAKAIADWAAESIADLGPLDPGPLEPGAPGP